MYGTPPLLRCWAFKLAFQTRTMRGDGALCLLLALTAAGADAGMITAEQRPPEGGSSARLGVRCCRTPHALRPGLSWHTCWCGRSCTQLQ